MAPPIHVKHTELWQALHPILLILCLLPVALTHDKTTMIDQMNDLWASRLTADEYRLSLGQVVTPMDLIRCLEIDKQAGYPRKHPRLPQIRHMWSHLTQIRNMVIETSTFQH
jgi:hypothetical protein